MSEPVTAVLTDGRQVRLRPASPEDEPPLIRLHEGLSERSTYLRFFSINRRSGAAFVHRALGESGAFGESIVAELGGEPVGMATYETLESPHRAEVALVVADRCHSSGVGTLMLEHLASRARSRGVESFHAEVLAENADALRVFTDMGLTTRMHRDGGTLILEVPLRYDERYLDALAEREGRADVASLRPLLAPGVVAVIGASRRPASVGNAVVRHLVEAGFAGPVYPVNPHADTIVGLRAYPSVADLPTVPDLAVLAIPAAAVPDAAEDCGRRGVRGLVVLSAGFAEGDAARLREIVRRHGMRMIGPNCIGVANTDTDVRLDATFTRSVAAPGPVGVVTQSGGLGLAIAEALRNVGLGVSTFASIGNKYDVSGNDLLLWWRHEDRTKVAMLYLESFGNPRKFARLARHLGRRTPLVAMRAGTTPEAQQAARSHTAATATPAVTRDELFRQAGLIATDDLGEAIDVVTLLAHQPLPAGPRVAVVANAGGAGVIAADACARHGLELPPLAPGTQRALTDVLPELGGAVANPIDTTAGVTPELFASVLATVAADPAVDAVIPIVTPTALGSIEDVLDAIAPGPPTAAVLLSQPENLTVRGDVPVYGSITAAVAALARAARYAAWRAADPGTRPELTDIDKDAATEAIDGYLAAHPEGGWLDWPALDAVARSYRLPVAGSTVAHDPDAAATALSTMDGPVAMKALAADLVHRSDERAIVLDVHSAERARETYRQLADRFGERLQGVLVQRMIPSGVEMLVGVTQDASFGPLVQVGAGGVTTDVLRDRAARLLPLTDRDAEEMVRSLRVAPLLSGFRGAAPLDVAALLDAVHRVARLAEDLPSVAELDINPLIVHPTGAVAVDVKIRVSPATSTDPYLRRLR